ARLPDSGRYAGRHRCVDPLNPPVPLEPLGEVGGDRLAIELVGGGAAGAAEERGASVADALDCTLAVLRHAWEQALPEALGDDAFVPPPLER
ncbi:MAG: hypothetical protein ACLQBX_16310, partial [Candidatus Limnocylindrales bacterium]